MHLRFLKSRLIFPLLSALILSGCVGENAREIMGRMPYNLGRVEVAGIHEIFVATTRKKAEKPREIYGGLRSDGMSYATVTISVPLTHKTGHLERPTTSILKPHEYFTAVKMEAYQDRAAISPRLSEQIRKTNGRVLLFVHGYNTYFDESVYRMTQIVHDSGYGGTPFLFTWASAGRLIDYVYDNNSATMARDSLEETFRMLSANGATRIDVIAHSMGNWLLMETFRQMALAKETKMRERLGDVLLASPDIDVDVFKTQMRRIGKPEKPFILMYSKNDRALSLSGLIAGNRPRLGGISDAKDIAELGIIAVDVSSVSGGDPLGHTRFAENPELIKMLGQQLERDDELSAASDGNIASGVDGLARGLGQTLSSAASIIITTPLSVARIAASGNGR
ncbi:alpha/beta hydrolase [Limoniibacter endophyticus]|uniref:Esterase/lipase superfamily enzyme n=1 Tax=Limoniibacter endophyticus TaxID=1565040 RepID=A0A8J3DLM2_9HYPH|nr:alpha/beta hydrolase [Limoniibacter endophyticus]GHC60851.1 hypothetical protein GCM10010136_01120 [Limoniibacter endophyticus]